MISDLLAIRKSTSVKRYHTETLLQEETVGHHVANVCTILCWLYKFHGIQARVLRAAVLHDASEVYTGDTPAPVKWEYAGIEANLKKAEQDFWSRLTGWEQPYRGLTDSERAALKFADMADLCLKCIHEKQLGNNTIDDIFLRGVVVMEERSTELPEIIKSQADILMQHIRRQHEGERKTSSREPLYG